MNITIIIPTKNRSLFITRQLKYYSESDFSGHIFIGDSSDIYEYKKNKSSIDMYSNSLNIRHFYDESLTAERMADHLCTFVKTDYLSLLMDDDIILTNSLDKSIYFLDNNPGYSGVHGKSFLMEVDACSNQPYGSSASLIEVDEMAVSEGKSSESRIADFFIKVRNVNMSVVRTDIGIASFKEVCKLSNYYASNIFGELIQATVVISMGKIKELDCYYLIKQVHHDQLFSKLDFYDWITGSEWRNSYDHLISIINRGLMNDESQDNVNCLYKAEDILKQYMSKIMLNGLDYNNYKKHKFSTKVKEYLKQINIVRVFIDYYRPVKSARTFHKIVSGDNNSSSEDLITYRKIVLDD